MVESGRVTGRHSEHLLGLLPQLGIAAGDFGQSGEHQSPQLPPSPGEVIGDLSQGKVEALGDLTVARARAVVHGVKIVALEHQESDLARRTARLEPQLLDGVREQRTDPLPVEPGVGIGMGAGHAELTLRAGEVQGKMGRAAPPLEPVCRPVGRRNMAHTT